MEDDPLPHGDRFIAQPEFEIVDAGGRIQGLQRVKH